MSERISKELAKDIVDRDIRLAIERTYSEKPNTEINCELALDIAIESLEREDNIEDSIIQLRALGLTLEDLKEVGSIDENIFNTFSKIIKQIIERLEPYKESE